MVSNHQFRHIHQRRRLFRAVENVRRFSIAVVAIDEFISKIVEEVGEVVFRLPEIT